MRLINTTTLRMEEFIGRNVPKYAILSHTWDGEEVSFAAFASPSCVDIKGYYKIKMACQQAAVEGLEYAWVDTCCIDKSSSAELSEAINSMYRWYQRSEVCYAYLSDFSASGTLKDDLSRCRWFTRGWALQELVAPTKLHIFDQDWNYRGSKQEMVQHLSTITGINVDALRHTSKLSSVSVAQKMSWAACRETTRVEDMAYCLLGIFDVNMPLLYGEEEKAFWRLQEEIIKTTADLSILAWTSPSPPDPTNQRTYCGALADSPANFSGCGSVVKVPSPRKEFSVTNRGVKINLQIFTEGSPHSNNLRYVLPLDCSGGTSNLGIRIKMCGSNEFVRENPWGLLEIKNSLLPQPLRERYLLSKLPELEDDDHLRNSNVIAAMRSHVLQIVLPPEAYSWSSVPWRHFDDDDMLFFVSGDSACTMDCGGVSFGGKFELNIAQQLVKIPFRCMFYAVGWSSPDPEQLQCTLFDSGPHKVRIADLHSHVAPYGNHKSWFLNRLAKFKIPKVPWAAFPVPGTGLCVMVTYDLKLVDDPNVCHNQFWRVKFSCQTLPKEDVPQLWNEMWKKF